jgi:hypothetical protein
MMNYDYELIPHHTNNVKSEVSGAFIINSSTATLRINLNEHPILSQEIT